jgi:hypothetical protein
VLTYFNGRAQPFRQLYSGLAGYEELQEGLAVLSEYLAGGFSRPRLRLLAARVIAVRRLIEGASFLETFRELDRQYEFSRYTAFTVTMRVYRAGGLTKDACYFKGLLRLLEALLRAPEARLTGVPGVQRKMREGRRPVNVEPGPGAGAAWLIGA